MRPFKHFMHEIKQFMELGHIFSGGKNKRHEKSTDQIDSENVEVVQSEANGSQEVE